MNVLSRTNSRALLNWVEQQGESVFLRTDRELAADAAAALGFTVTESNFAGARKELGLTKSRSDQKTRTLREDILRMRQALDTSFGELQAAERRAHEQAEVIETLISRVEDHRTELLRQTAQLCTLAKKVGVPVEFVNSELSAASALSEPSKTMVPEVMTASVYCYLSDEMVPLIQQALREMPDAGIYLGDMFPGGLGTSLYTTEGVTPATVQQLFRHVSRLAQDVLHDTDLLIVPTGEEQAWLTVLQVFESMGLRILQDWKNPQRLAARAGTSSAVYEVLPLFLDLVNRTKASMRKEVSQTPQPTADTASVYCWLPAEQVDVFRKALAAALTTEIYIGEEVESRDGVPLCVTGRHTDRDMCSLFSTVANLRYDTDAPMPLLVILEEECEWWETVPTYFAELVLTIEGSSFSKGAACCQLIAGEGHPSNVYAFVPHILKYVNARMHGEPRETK